MLSGQAGGDATENMEDAGHATGATEWSQPHVIVQDMYTPNMSLWRTDQR